jgi:hypothetical protein
MSTGAQQSNNAPAERPVNANDEAARIAADLAYNAGKAGDLQRVADKVMHDEIMLRIMLREVS